MTAATGTATACRANIGASGHRLRTTASALIFVVAAALLGWMVAAHVPAPWRLLLFFPVALGSVVGLQARRHTCVAMAVKGVLENEDFSTTPVEEEFARASRRVAATILRDGVLIGIAGALLGAATAL